MALNFSLPQTGINGIVYLTDEEAGIVRKRSGKGFAYYDQKGRKISDPEVIRRIKQLVIPPNWKQVWISPQENSHIQATGRDDRGRKQYIYHRDFVTHRQNKKFDHLLEFASHLPLIRKKTLEDLRKKKWTKSKVLALIIQVLDQYPMRIGNSYYMRENNSFGLTTLRRKHLSFGPRDVTFSFKAKSNVQRKISICNPRLVRLIKECSELPGHEIFRYYDEDGVVHSVSSGDVNQYLYEITGKRISSKDFRTWAGTTHALRCYLEGILNESTPPSVKSVLKAVAEILGNTVSVCREYYIHPRVMEAIEKNKLPLKIKAVSEDLEIHEEIAIRLIKRR